MVSEPQWEKKYSSGMRLNLIWRWNLNVITLVFIDLNTHQVFQPKQSHIKSSTKTGEQTFVSRESVNKIVSFREDQMDQVVVRTSYDEFKIGVTRAHTPPAETTEKHTWP